MTDKLKKLKELILKYPNLSGNKIYEKSKSSGISIRKKDFYSLLRSVRKLPEPTIEKKLVSIPAKHRTKATTKQITKIKKIKKVKPKPPKAKPKPPKPKKIPFDKTKFGKMVKKIEKRYGLSEKRAIERARFLKKIPKRDYNKLRKSDRDIALQYKT